MGHDHDHGRPTPRRALRVALILNAGFLLVEALVGWWTNSLALLSDAAHMLSDVGALTIALVAARMSERKPSGHLTFGMRRAPVLGGLVNAVALVVTVIFIVIEAIERLNEPPALQGMPILITGALGLGVNLGSAWYLAKSRDSSVNTRGAMLHLMADALGSVAAVVAALAVLLWNFSLADPIASFIIGVLILAGTWPLLRDSIRILLQIAPTGVSIETIRSIIERDPRVVSVEDLHVWELDSGQPILTAVLTVSEPDVVCANELCDAIRAELAHQVSIEHATLECRHTDRVRIGCSPARE